ncbi:MAG TPA: hypothetical protein VIP46_15620 [Pyrinomonadaceae bacterium]
MRRNRFSLSLALCCAAAASLLLPAGRTLGQDSASPRNVTGAVVGVGGRLGGRTLPFRLIIDRYTSDAEVQRLNSALQRGGQDALLRELEDMKAGRIQVGNNVGVEANAIIASPSGETGTRIIVLFRRNLDLFELRYGRRSQDYRFGYAELFLRGRGAGEGTFIPAAQVRLRDGNTWEVEDFGVFPARLIGLRGRGRVGVR